MRARSLEILDKSVAAMIAAIEIYNKPDFLYREETFSVLSITGWELLLKAYWLKINRNKINCLYVYESSIKRDGTKGKKRRIKLTRSNNPFTHGIDYLAKKLINDGKLDQVVWDNIQALIEIRDNAVHFYNKSGLFSLRLQEVGSASLKNYVEIIRHWFEMDLSSYNFFLMPLSFVNPPNRMDGISLSKEERNIIAFIESLEENDDPNKPYSVSVNININFSRSKAKDAIKVQISNDSNATKVQLTEEQFRDRWPFDYQQLTDECKGRYKNFKSGKKYHDLRKSLDGNDKYCKTRHLDPGNPKSQKKTFYSRAILSFFDGHYEKKT